MYHPSSPSHTRGHRQSLPRLVSIPAVAALLLSGAATPALAAPNHGPGHADTAAVSRVKAPNTLPGAVDAAIAEAANTGRPVAVASQTTETHELDADPNGSLTSTDSPLPVRVERNGSWVPLSAVLTRDSDGTYSPAATPSRVTLSGGGNGPLAVLGDPADHQLSYRLPFPLPAPTVSGATALYPAVLPGVDLSVSVTDQGGISDVLIVHNASAAADPQLAELDLSASTRGLTLATDPEGGLAATAADGELSYTSPKPVMWDSSTVAAPANVAIAHTDDTALAVASSSAAGPGTGARIGPVAMSVASHRITLVPDKGLLTGSQTRFPLYIDPSINPVDTESSGAYDEVYSDSECSGAPQYNTPQTDGEGVGYQSEDLNCGTGLERSFYTLPLSAVPSNATVSSSVVSVADTYAASYNCSENQPVTLHTTGSINGNTDWNNQPSTDDSAYAPVATTVASGANPSSTCSDKSAVFTVTSQVQKLVSAGNSSWTIGLLGDESPQDSSNVNYLRFSTVMSITTTFDVPPTTPTDPHTVPDSADPSGPGCNNTGTGWIGATGASGVTFYATLSTEMKGQNLQGEFDVWDNNLNNGSGGATDLENDQLTGAWVGSGGTASTTVTGLKDGHEYGWAARSEDDNSLHLQSPWVTECHFVYDDTPPSTPAVTTSDPSFPPLGSGTASAGFAGASSHLSLTVSATDPLPANTCTLGTCQASGISRFIWKLDGQPTVADNDGTEAVASTGTDSTGAPTGTATITVPVANWGVHNLYIAALDNAGNISQVPTSYTFYAPWNPATKIDPGDINGDGIPDLLATSKTGDLDLISGNSGPDTAPELVSPAADSPTGANSSGGGSGTWNDYWIAHRGSLVGGAVDDLYAYDHVTHDLYGVENDLDPGGNGTAGYTLGRVVDFAKTKPACDADAPASRCGTAAGYDATDWNDVTQIAAPGDVYAGLDGTNQFSDLITVENGQLWLYRGISGPALSSPVLLGDGDWSNFTLISPGTVTGTPTLWARDNTSGNVYSFNISPTGTPALPPLLHAPNSTVTPLTSGVTASGGGRLCLADPNASTANGTDMIIWGCEANASQSFTLAADNTVHIMGKCLDVSHGGTTNGTAVDINTCNGTGAETWTNGANGSLVNPESGLCLADPGSAVTPDTDVILWTCDNGSEQNWNGGSAAALPTAPTATSIINLPTSTDPYISSPGDVNGPISATDPTGAPDGNPDLYVIDTTGQLIEYPGGPATSGTPTFTSPVSLGTVTNTADHAWSLADGSGTTAHDSLDTNGSNNPGLDATLTGGATWDTDPTLTIADPGLANGGNLQLDGTTGYAATSTPAVNTSASYTVSAWVKINSTSTYQTALCQRDATGARCGFYLQYSPAMNGWTFISPATDVAAPPGYYMAGQNQHATVGVWTHLVAVFDAATGNMSLYVNGHLAGIGNDPSPWQATGPFLIGAEDNADNGTQAQFAGQIADVHLYNTALPPADAADLGDTTPLTDLN